MELSPKPMSQSANDPNRAQTDSRPSSAAQSQTLEFGSFYRATLAPLRTYLSRLLGDPAEAQDIAQDAYLKTYEAMHDHPVEKPQAYLFTAARRLAANYRIRRGNRMKPAEAAFIEARAGATSDAAQAVILKQEDEAFEAAILALPPGCQQVLVLRLRHGLSHEEIAGKLGLATSTVGNQLTRAIRLLRARLPALAEPGATEATGARQIQRLAQ